MPEQLDLIYLSPISWSSLFQRPQQLMRRLAASFRVLYVEPAADIATFLGHPTKWNRLRQLEPRLYVYSPLVFRRDRRNERLTIRNNRSVGRMITTAAQMQGAERTLLIVGTPHAEPLVDTVCHDYLAYDCLDEFREFIHDERGRCSLEARERRLLADSDFVMFTSEELRQRKKDLARRSFTLRNGADFDHFAARPLIVPEDISSVPHPIIGFHGAIYEWVDLDLVCQAAELHPDWSFVMIGPVQRGIVLPRLSNIYFLGMKPYTQLPSYLHQFDVCILPFRQNALTMAVNPVKVYEYLAAGKPVVSTYLPDLAPLENLVMLARSREQFQALLERAILDSSANEASYIAARQTYAHQNDWATRAQEITHLIKTTLNLDFRDTIADRGFGGKRLAR